MMTVAYQFHVLTRDHENFCDAWHAAHDTLKNIVGLYASHLHAPDQPRQPFTIVLRWTNRASFDRFIHTWVGVGIINGMGLDAHDFFAPTRTRVDENFISPSRLRAA